MNRKRRQHEATRTDETWLIPYADLLTLLLALFIVLFASSQIDAQRFQQISQTLNAVFSGNVSILEHPSMVEHDSPVDGIDSEQGKIGDIESDQELSLEERFALETTELEKLKAELDKYISEQGLESLLQTELNSQQFVITIRDNALFDLGSATVKPEARRLAIAISEFLVDYPQFEVVVSGHTDNLPINTAQFRSNWDLSAYRALNFMKVLLENDKLDPARFSNVAYGEYRPIASNDTAEGRAQNRRVEISLLRNIILPEEEAVTIER